MSRPILTLKKKPAAAPVEKRGSGHRAARRLAKLGLPLFQRMEREGVVLPMAYGIREAVLARLDLPLRSKARVALACLARSGAYRRAVIAVGAHRYDLDGVDVGPVSEADRLHAQRARQTITAVSPPS